MVRVYGLPLQRTPWAQSVCLLSAKQEMLAMQIQCVMPLSAFFPPKVMTSAVLCCVCFVDHF